MPANNPNTRFPKNFREFVIELNRHQVDYMIIKGYAVGAYGYARDTNVLDIFTNASEQLLPCGATVAQYS